MPKEFGEERLDVALVQLFPDVSRKKIKRIIDDGGAYVNKKRAQFAKQIVNVGAFVEIFWNEKMSENNSDEKPANSGLSRSSGLSEKVIFECEDFFILDKTAGMAAQATLESTKDSVLFYLTQADSKRFPEGKIFLVHRLDKDTSGLMIIARNKLAQKYLESLFLERKVQKEYEALCFSKPKFAKGSISFPIVKSRSAPNTFEPVFSSSRQPQGSRTAVTDYSVVKEFSNSDASHLRLFPKTGRTHQIRVHLMALGCPILGDKTYSRGIVGHELYSIALRQMLHAAKLSFVGRDGTKYFFEVPPPQDFKDCLTSLNSREGK